MWPSCGVPPPPICPHVVVGGVTSGNRVNLYVWYDNEFGYACQVIRLLQRVSGVVFGTFPQPGATASSPLVE